jgi:indolepyruvate ferredoxin oxidoreductase
LRVDDRVAAIGNAIGNDNLATLNANRLADQLMGDTIYANVLLLGYAWQSGLVPVSFDALMRK